MNKEEIIALLPEIKRTVQMAFEREIFGRLVVKGTQFFICFYFSKVAFDNTTEGKYSDFFIVQGKDGLWSVIKYDVYDYGSKDGATYGYMRISTINPDPDLLKVAGQIVEHIND